MAVSRSAYLEEIFLSQHGVVELDLGVAFVEFLADFGVSDRGAARDQVAQLVEQDLFFYALFEHRHG